MPKRIRGRAAQAARAALAPLVTAGLAHCYRCGDPIHPTDPWDADHPHALAQGGDPRGTVVPSHRSCNRGHGQALALGLDPMPAAGARLRPRFFLEAITRGKHLPPHFSPQPNQDFDPESTPADSTSRIQEQS